MSLFAGVVSLDAHASLSPEPGDALVAALSRHAGDRARIHRGRAHLLAQVVLPGRSEDCTYGDDSGRVTLLAGEPLFAGPAGGRSEVHRLHAALVQSDRATLCSARDSYCAVHWDPRSRCLRLVADKLGLRPIYYGVENGLFFFSTALRVFEQIGALTHSMDVRGVAEIASFGYPLASRSPYEAVRTIEAGEIVQATAAGVHGHNYWHWDRLPVSGVSTEELPRAVFEAFMDAIDRRLHGHNRVLAGLSGGLDSRCLVAALRARSIEVDTLNFAPAGSEDLILGRMAAQALQTRHFEFTRGPLEFWDRMRAAHEAWLREAPREDRPTDPHRLWSGDGGSCGMGHIYLDRHVVDLMREGDTEGATSAYLRLNRIGLPPRLLARSARKRLLDYPHDGVRAELKRLEGADATRRMHLYLMVNGQRRLLAKHYENIDMRRFELVTPFFDADLLQLVLSSPIEGFLGHRFYNRWLEEFPAAVRQVPWQAYPGHEPCPVAKPTGLRSQWDNWYDKHQSRELARRDLALADELLRNVRLPEHLFDRRVLRLARWLTGLGLGDYGYLFKVAETFARYSRPS